MAGSLPPQLLFSSFQSFADAKRSFPGYCASNSPDWKGETARNWSEHCAQVCEPFRSGLLKPEHLGEDRGRGLLAGAAIKRGERFCADQPPLAFHQYDDSRRVCETCAHCRRFVGSLGSALRRPLAAARGAARPEELVEGAAALEELESEEWTLRKPVPCRDGCSAVFCTPECEAQAREGGWHRVLCTDLKPEKRPVWGLFCKHAVRYQEHFIMAAQVIAEIVCLVRHSGADLLEAMAFFTRFAKMSWLSMVSLPSRSCTQAFPQRGHLSRLARMKRERREEVMTQSLEMLVVLLWERRFAELLTLDFYANLVGQFSLSNVWVQIEHPLSERFRARAASDPEFKRRFGRLAEASAKAALQVAGEEEAELRGGEDGEKAEGEAGPVEMDEESIWWLPRLEASGLYVCCALSNHSCLPNFNMSYAEGAAATMYALRDVAEGEELHLAYVSPAYELSERLASLWRHWGFVCTCRKCQDDLMSRVVADSAAATGPAAAAGLRLTPGGAAAAASLAGLCPGSPAGARAVAALTGAEQPPRPVYGPSPPPAASDEESEAESSSEEEEEEEEEDDDSDEAEAGEAGSSGSSDEFESGAAAVRPALGGPLGPRAVPASVAGLQADLQRLLQVMEEEG